MKKIKTKIIRFDERSLEEALQTIINGGVIAFPTDTVYGIAVSAFNPPGIEKLYEIKERPNVKAIPVLVGTMEQLDQVASNLPPYARKLVNEFWPGALTLVVPALASLPPNLSPTPTIGVRMPDHLLLRELIRRSGPLATTSANLSGYVNSLTAQEVVEQLGGRVNLVLDGGKTQGEIPSTVVDCTHEKGRVLREGTLTQRILSVINED